MASHDAEILIVGGGPVGLGLAIELGDNLVFLAGTTTFLNIYATSLYLNSSGSRFGITTGGVSDGTLPSDRR